MSFNERTIMAMGREKYEKIRRHHVVLIGVGGVGGAVLECLVRFGMEKITVIDYDTVDITNLNRQLIATQDTVGMLKVEAAKKRAAQINPLCDVTGYNMFVSRENLDFIRDLKADYIIDCFDTVKAKADLIEFCRTRNLKIISAMGTGGRFSVDGFVIDTLDKSAGNGCGLCRVMRHELKKRGITQYTCLFNKMPPESKSTKDANGRHAPGSTPFAPNIAGIMIAQYVCRQLAE